MIFAAGLGTRLKPLTDTMPKALVPFAGKPLLWHAVKSMEEAGIKRIVVNVHHFARQIKDYISSRSWEAEVVVSDESGLLLDTGGGLLKAQALFIPNKPVLVRNVDIVTSADIKSFVSAHYRNKCDATLMVKKRNTSRYLVFDEEMNLCAWKNTKTNEQIVVKKGQVSQDLAFSGIHMIEQSLLSQMGELRPFSIIKAYLNLVETNVIKGFKAADDEAWYDVGTIEKLREAELYYKSGKFKINE